MVWIFIAAGVITLVLGILVKEYRQYGMLDIYKWVTTDSKKDIARVFGLSMYFLTGVSFCFAIANLFMAISKVTNITLFVSFLAVTFIQIFIRCDRIAAVPKRTTVLKVAVLGIFLCCCICYYWFSNGQSPL